MDEGTTTTLASPALDHIIERPRLIELLREGNARLVLFVAPAGYGKTTLARQWSAKQTGPVAWYRTTRASGDVAALAVGLDELLNRTVPQPRRDPRRIAAIASVNAHPHPLARALVSTYATLPEDLLLVLDEWETAGTEEADELVGHLVDELDIRVLVTSRTHPPWFTSRLTVYGEGLEVGIDELTMTDEEALAVLSIQRSPENPEPLLTTARGWPAVLGLAAMRAATELPPTSVPAKTLYDYLASELLDSAPEEMRWGLTLLSAASVTDVATAELLLGDKAAGVLDAAGRRNLVRVEDDRSISLHPLLRDQLVARLQRMNQDDVNSVLEGLAPLIAGERWDETLAAAEAMPDERFISTALLCALPHLLRAGRVTTLKRWVGAGRSAHTTSALVDYAEAEVAFRDASFEHAIALGDVAAQTLTGDFSAKAHLVTARAANLADRLQIARKHFQEAEELATSAETRAAALWGCFVQAVDDERRDANEALAVFQRTSCVGPEQMIRVAHGRVRLALLEGDLRSKLDDTAILASLLESEVDPMVRSSFLNIQSTAFSVAGLYEDGLRAAEHEYAIAEDFELEFVLRHALINRARALVGLRRIAAAERALRDVERRLVGEDDLFLSANISIERCRLYLTLGDTERAYACLFRPAHFRLNKGTSGEYLALRAVLLATLGRCEAARADARAARVSSRLIEVHLLAAVASCLAEQRDKGALPARQCARAVFDAAYRAGALDAIVLGCRASLAFASEIAGANGQRDALTETLKQSRDAGLARRLNLTVPRTLRRSPKLSSRELEIHELIAQGLTNPEISSLLFISPSTTKVHVRHILEKLGVRSRVEAARLWTSPDVGEI